MKHVVTRILELLGLVVFGYVLVMAFLFAIGNAAPCPENPVTHRCVKPSVSYSYEQDGIGIDGRRYVRTCHVPVRGKRWCGPWLLLRRAFPATHIPRSVLRP